MSYGHGESRPGLIGFFVRHSTAPNLVMMAMIILGFLALGRLNVQFFPTIGLDIITVSVDWSGASAEDVDSNIVQALEPEVRFLDGVKHVRSTSREGSASITIEYDAGTDMQNALSQVENAVSQVTILPEDSDEPVISKVQRYDAITRLVLSGPLSEGAIKALAKQIRDDLLARGVDKVDLIGARDEEIWVEVPQAILRQLNLSLSDIATKIRQISQDLPAGGTNGEGARQIRSLGQVKEARTLADLDVVSKQAGEQIRLGDIAKLSEAFDENDVQVMHNGQPGIELFVQRATTADALKVDDIVVKYLDQAQKSLPQGVTLERYDVAADLIRGRIDLLMRNGYSGFILVLAILFLFLNTRVAFWVAAGIPVSLLATMVVMLATGQTINMVSLFGLIMAIGIVVDDAIVVGEHAEQRRRNGLPPLDAAEAGARRMAVPVLASSLTTIAAFAPLLIIGDVIGQVIVAIPYVAISVILASLIECFFVLPGHMRHALKTQGKNTSAFRKNFNARFNSFRDGAFQRAVRLCVTWRYATLAGAVGLLIVSVGLLAGGRVTFQFFVGPEAEKIYANVQMVAGTPRDQTLAALVEVERALHAAEGDFAEKGLVKTVIAKLGTRIKSGAGAASLDDNLGGLFVELSPSDTRTVRTNVLINAWQAHLKDIPGIEALAITAAQTGPPGLDIDVRLSGNEMSGLKSASLEIQELLKTYAGISSVEDDLPWGKEEVVLSVNARGRALGFTTENVGRQLRDAFDGAVAQRFPRGDEEVLIRVQYPRTQIGNQALVDFYVMSPSGAEVALSDVVDLETKVGFSTVKREDGTRQVAITGELDKAQTSTNQVIAALTKDGVAAIAARHGVTVGFKGKAEEQQRTFGDMKAGVVIGLSAIYIILAWIFSSYSKPLVVMSVIPFGFVGAAFGHLIMGYSMTILSLVALVGLSGIVVNDSIILVSAVQERSEAGESPLEAIIGGARDRLRAVILTSATTIGGLTPMMFETSLQAHFLIPMAITIVFGLFVATLLVLLVVPSLMAVLEDLRALKARFRARETLPG